MLTHIEATCAHSAGRRPCTRMPATVATIALAILLAGCNPVTTQLAARDPADPAAPAPPVGYRSTIAPYSSLRPATPGPWSERNEQVAPSTRSGREAQ